MSASSSVSLGQTGSTTTSRTGSSSSRRSSVLNAVVKTLNVRKKRRAYVEASVVNASHDNTTYNYGSMNVGYGNNIIQNINVGIDPLDVLVLNMTRSLNAEFDITVKAQREPCAPYTRQYVLRHLKSWCKKKVDFLMYWLSGMPGTGKTTIVYTLCQYLQERGLLGASFFCSRLVQDCQEIQLIFPTIAFQLAKNFPVYGKRLAEALRKDPDLPRRKLAVQLQQLIIEPFHDMESHLPSNLVVVLDALDECSSGQSSFIRVLVDFSSQLPFRLVLTSRPECNITEAMRINSVSPPVQSLVLHEIEKEVVREDIIKYLNHTLSSAIPPVNEVSITALANHSGSSFILAATTARLVMEAGDPLERLESVLRALSTRNAGTFAAALDTLYADTISRIMQAHGQFQNELEDIKKLLFTIICACEPLTKQSLALLWGKAESTVARILRPLGSVIYVPEDPTKPITIFHETFTDFITDEARAGAFFCDIAVFHGKLAAACFRTVNAQLRPDIRQLKGMIPNEQIPLDDIISQIKAGLAYAIVHWGYHLEMTNAFDNAEFLEECQKFCSNHLFHWIESLSLLGKLPIFEKSLGILRTHTQGKTVDLIRDTCQFIQLNFDVINYSAAEIYNSALIWVPATSTLRSQYPELWKQEHLPQAITDLNMDWEGSSRTVPIHEGQVKTVVTTPDGKFLVSGSDDQTIRVWNVATHTEEHIFTGHQGEVNTVAVSPNGDRIFSASDDRTVRVWDAVSPKIEPILVFEGHSEMVLHIAVSRDGKLGCSCDLGNNVLVWDTDTAQVVHSLSSDGRLRSDTRSVNFSPDNDHIIYSSQNAVHIYSLHLAAVSRSLKGHEGLVRSVAMSHCGTLLLTGSSDNTAKVWKFSSGKKIRTLRGHTGVVQCVAFCHDNSRGLSGSDDNTIRIWNIHTGIALAVLTGHTRIVWSITVFPDDLHAVSGSADSAMVVWDVSKWTQKSSKKRKTWGASFKFSTFKQGQTAARSAAPWSGRFLASSSNLACFLLDKSVHVIDSSSLEEKTIISTGTITSAAFSPRETHLATASKHNIFVWNIATGRKILKIKVSEQEFMHVTFSHDESRILTGSDNGQIRVWSAKDGTEQLAFQQNDATCYVAFSPDDAQILTASRNKMACVWTASTGRLKHLIETENWRAPTSFSADGKYVFECATHATLVRDTETGNIVCSHDNHRNWTPLPSGVSYSILNFSWICMSPDPLFPPRKLCWIPPQYRIPNTELWTPISFPSPTGDRVLLANTHGTVVLGFNV